MYVVSHGTVNNWIPVAGCVEGWRRTCAEGEGGLEGGTVRGNH